MLFLIDWETDLRNSKYEQYNMTIANIKIDQNTLQAKKKTSVQSQIIALIDESMTFEIHYFLESELMNV